MNKTIYRWRVLISDFFNKIPTIILIPGILLGSFLVALLLIWSGTKVAVIDVVEPSSTSSNTNKNKSPGSGNKNGNFDADFDYSENNPTNQGANGSENPAAMSKNGSEVSDNQSAGSSQGSGGESNSPDANSALTPTNDNTNGQTRSGQTNGGQSSSSSSGSTGPGAAKRLPSYSYGNSNDNTNLNANVSGDCTYPMGDVKLWWRRAPKKQRDCYIKKNGIPDFLANEPYFCDYEKNEDCYVK